MLSVVYGRHPSSIAALLILASQSPTRSTSPMTWDVTANLILEKVLIVGTPTVTRSVPTAPFAKVQGSLQFVRLEVKVRLLPSCGKTHDHNFSMKREGKIGWHWETVSNINIILPLLSKLDPLPEDWVLGNHHCLFS